MSNTERQEVLSKLKPTLVEGIKQLLHDHPPNVHRALYDYLGKLNETTRLPTNISSNAAPPKPTVDKAIQAALVCLNCEGYVNQSANLSALLSSVQEKIKEAAASPPAAAGNISGAFQGPAFVSIQEIRNSVLKVEQAVPIVMIDARWNNQNPFDYGKTEFAKCHAKGAFFLDIESVAAAFDTKRSSARHPLPPAEHFIAFCRARGIGCTPAEKPNSPPDPVVVMDDSGGVQGAARVWWMLRNLGVEAYLLDGGLPAYIAAGLPLAYNEPFSANALPSETQDTPQHTWRGKSDWDRSRIAVEAEFKDPKVKRRVDCRPMDRYGSQIRPEGPDPVAGHFPDSYNMPAGGFCVAKTVEVLNEGLESSSPSPTTPKTIAVPYRIDPEEAKKKVMVKVYGGADGNAENTILYCFSGLTACIVLANCVQCGLGEPRMFVESFSGLSGQSKNMIAEAQIVVNGACVNLLKRFPGAPLVTDETLITLEDGMQRDEAGSSEQKPTKTIPVGQLCQRCTEEEPSYIDGLFSGKALLHGADIPSTDCPLPKVLATAVRKLRLGEEAIIKTKFCAVSILVKKPPAPAPAS